MAILSVGTECDEPAAAEGAWHGVLLYVFTAEIAGAEMLAHQDARLIAGHGVEGDRYAIGRGHYSYMPHLDRQVTLIEVETLEALERDHGINLTPAETRRNLVTRGVPVNHLVGRRFRVGGAILYGGRLNVPCKYLEDLLDKPVFNPLINRSGLNCQIIEGASVRPGDRIVPC
jgi:MOSC domain-containing protein YiiM